MLPLVLAARAEMLVDLLFTLVMRSAQSYVGTVVFSGRLAIQIRICPYVEGKPAEDVSAGDLVSSDMIDKLYPEVWECQMS